MKQRAPLSEYALRNRSSWRFMGSWLVGIIAIFFCNLAVIDSIGNMFIGKGLSGGVLIFSAPLGGWWLARTAYQRYLDQNDRDFGVSRMIQTNLAALLSAPPPAADISVPGIHVYQQMRVGEVSRHFDNQINGSIAGWIDHQLGFQGWGVGLRTGRVGLSSVGLVDYSGVNLTFSGVMRQNLLADGFLTVLEVDLPSGLVDTLRVIVPSEPALRAFVSQYVKTLGKVFGEGSHCDTVLTMNISMVQQSFTVYTSYVSDRLYTILRMPLTDRPKVTVVGSQITEHAIVGSAMQFGNDNRWYQLFPISLLARVSAIAAQANAVRLTLPTSHP